MRSRRSIVLLVIACLLRALLPCIDGGGEVVRLADSGATPAFRCAGHGCCCTTIEQCAGSCCCFPETSVEPAELALSLAQVESQHTLSPATRASDRTRGPTHVLQALQCGGGLPGAALVSFAGVIAVAPRLVCVAHAPSPSARLCAAVLSPHTTHRPSPKTPPPRLRSHVV